MSLLSDRDLKDLIDSQQLKVEPFEYIFNPTSIDLSLGSILVQYTDQTIRLDTIPEFREIDITNNGYLLKPGEFILGMTREAVCIPNGYQGLVETKGNIARSGIQVHNSDGHIDPGFSGHITLEITNMHNNIPIQLIAGVFICQLFIFQLSSPSDMPYNGR